MFGAIKLANNVYHEKRRYTGYFIVFIVRSKILLSNGELDKTTAIFGINNSPLVHDDYCKKVYLSSW